MQKQTMDGKTSQETVYLSDYEISQLNMGYSVRVGNVLLTFAEGSKRYPKGI